MSALLYDNWNPATRRSTTIELDSETGLPLIVHTQDYRPVVESAKRLASNFDRHVHPRNDMTHVARIPILEWVKLNKLGITSDQKAFNAYLDSREARQFRTDDARRI